MTKNKTSQTTPDYYHDTEKLLKTYRDARWNLKLSAEHHQQDFEMEYGMSVTKYLDDIYAAGASFEGTKLEHHANSMKRTAQMLNLVDTSLHLIRENYAEGEAFYWNIYYTYLSPQKLNSIEEVIERIKSHVPYITRDTYYKQRKKAISTFSSVLWGFTDKGVINILDTFV